MASIASLPARHELKITDLAKVLQSLRNHGYSVASYYNLGLYLGISRATLDVIKENNKGDIESCLRECLTKWLEKADDVQETKGGPTIYSLVSALRELGKKAVADGIDMENHPACKILAHYSSKQALVSALHQLVSLLKQAELIKEMILPPQKQGEVLMANIKEAVCIDYQKMEVFAVILCKCTSTAKIGSDIMKKYRNAYPNDDLIRVNYDIAPEELKIKLPTSVTSRFKMLRLKFGQTFFKVGTIMKNHRSLSLINVKSVLRTYDKALRPQLAQCKNFHSTLELISDNSSLDDISVLEFFIHEFNIEKAEKVIQEYKEAIKEFRKTKLSECLEEKFSYASLLECERITIVVDEDVNDVILKDVKRLVSAIFDNLRKHIKLNVIREGNSFTIICSFPLILSEQLISVAQSNIYRFRANKVKRLTIGYCTVYEVTEIVVPILGLNEQQFTVLSETDCGLLKQLMISLSVQMINSEEENSLILDIEAVSLIQKMDTKIKMLGDRRAESIECKAEYDELKKLKEVFKKQLGLFKEEEEGKVPAYKAQESFTRVNQKLPQIARSFNTSVVETKGLVIEATNGLEVVRKYKEVKEVPQVKESYRSLSNSTKAVHKYLDKVNGLYRTLKDQTPAVIENVESGDVRSTQELAVEINEVAQYCKDDYTTLLDSFREFGTNIDRAQGELMRLKEEAETKRRRRLAIAAAAATAGLALSVFTLGAGAVASAATTATAAAAITALAYFIAALATAVESFDKISSKRFKAHQYELIQNMIDEINRTMKENARIGTMTDADRRNLAMTMTDILEESIKLYNETSRELENAKRIKNTFTREVDNTFNE